MSCKHDCETPPLFPRPIYNRPGLRHIAYRIGDYAGVRAHLFAQLDQQAALSDWTHRDSDDPGIALLEADAIVIDVLTFYQQLYANQAYLRTAEWTDSVADLVRLTGYRLSPGVAGEGIFALTVKGTLPVTVPRGFGLKAQLEDVAQPVEFETRAALTAIPALSAFSLYRPRVVPAIAPGSVVLRLSDPDAPLKPGDRLLLGDAPGIPARLGGPELVTVDATWLAFGERFIRLKHALARGGAQLKAFKLGDTLRHFGHNAPNTITSVDSKGVPSTTAITYGRLLGSSTSAEVEPDLGALEMPLDRETSAIHPGDTLLVEGRFRQAPGYVEHRYTLVRRVTAAENRSLSWGAQTGASTVLTLDSSLDVSDGGHAHPSADVRTLSFLQVTAAPFTVYADYVDSPAASGHVLYFHGPAGAAQALVGRRLLLGAQERTVQSVVAGAAWHAVHLSAPVNYADFPYADPHLTVYGNVVDASQGKTVQKAPIGSGDARALFQTFAIPKVPLTYLFDATATPAQVPALDLFVDGIRWNRVDTLFGAGPLDQVYIVREDRDGKSLVQFGDGKTGARLKSGRDNVELGYRVGLGAHGVLKAGTQPQATVKLAELNKVVLTTEVGTGTGPEPASQARVAAPARLQSLGRLVSIADYEAETRQLPNVLKASARWDVPDGVPAIVLTMLTNSASAAEAARVRDALTGYNRCRGPARHPFVVIQGQRRFVHIDAVVGYDARYQLESLTEAIHAALGISGDDGLFSLQRRGFHESVHSSEVIGAIQNVAGVVWVRLQGAGTLAPGADPALLPLPAPGASGAPLIACPPHALLALHRSHCVLGFVLADAAMECAP
jgi:hypothetical protein